MTAAVASLSRFYALCEAARSALDRERKLEALAPLEDAMELNLRAMWLREARLLLEEFSPEEYALMGGKLREAAASPLEDALLLAQARNAPMAVKAWEGTDAAIMAGTQAAADDLGLTLSLSQENPLAVYRAGLRAANGVARINPTTRAYIRDVVRDGLAKGTSYQKVARQIVARYAEFGVPSPLGHIRSRAELVAVTEMGEAYVFGTMTKARSVRLPLEKHWLTVGDNRVDEGQCRPNERAGWIPLEELFPSGHDAPLAHPGCRCDVQTRLAPRAKAEEIPEKRARRPRGSRPRASRPHRRLAGRAGEELGSVLRIDPALDRAFVKQAMDEMNAYPPGAWAALKRLGLKEVHVGKGTMPDLDDLSAYRGVQPRGWSAGKTWNDVPGAYSRGQKVLVAGDGAPHGSRSILGHEGGHAMDDAFGLASDTRVRRMYSQTRDIRALSPYYLQEEGAGLSEWIAESMAIVYNPNPTPFMHLDHMLSGHKELWQQIIAEKIGP